jgi:S1-C subfamily serine protease
VHTTASTGAAFAILFAVVGASFAYASMNPIVLTTDEAWAGVVGRTLTPAIAEIAGTNEQAGFLVTYVYEDGPADRAGIRGGDRQVQVPGEEQQLCAGGDIIVEIDDRPVTNPQEIQSALEGKSIGSTVELTVLRGSVASAIPLVLDGRPLDLPEPACRVQ